jgi:hypothetical protein
MPPTARYEGPPTLAQVVRRAADVVDPAGEDDDVARLELAFEDADEPVTAVQDIEGRLALAVDGLDPELENGALSMAIATVIYLTYRRDELDDDPDDILRLAARAEWKGDPPDAVSEWLEARGIEV